MTKKRRFWKWGQQREESGAKLTMQRISAPRRARTVEDRRQNTVADRHRKRRTRLTGHKLKKILKASCALSMSSVGTPMSSRSMPEGKLDFRSSIRSRGELKSFGEEQDASVTSSFFSNLPEQCVST